MSEARVTTLSPPPPTSAPAGAKPAVKRRRGSRRLLMFGGGAETNIPKGAVIEPPYDSLDLVPTILNLMGLKGADQLPGNPIPELFPH